MISPKKKEKTKTPIKDQVAEIARDLMNLEVNTVIKASIVGRKMPDPRHALLDIARKFSVKLIDLKRPADVDGLKRGSREYFKRLMVAAANSIIDLEERSRETPLTQQEMSDMEMLWRIKTMSLQVVEIIKAVELDTTKLEFEREHDEIKDRDKPIPFSSEHLVNLRKIWEMGTEQIAMQTVIQLDGDVITRIQPKYATAKYTPLHELHRQGITTSMAFWRGLIDIAKDLLKGLLRLVFPNVSK